MPETTRRHTIQPPAARKRYRLSRPELVVEEHHILIAVTLCVCVTVAITTIAISWTLREISIVGFALQLVMTFVIARRSHRLLSLSTVFAGLWIIYFPLRLTVITWGGPSPYDFPAVANASTQQLVWLWLVLTGGFGCFTIGHFLLSQKKTTSFALNDLPITQGRYLGIGVLGLVVASALLVLHASSGILGNVGELSLFGIAGASYEEARSRSTRLIRGSVPLMLASVVLGYMAGFKQLALMPIIAWVVGRIAGGGRIRIRYVVVVFLAITLAFAVIQGERDSAASGKPTANPMQAAFTGLTQYNLAYGVRSNYQGLDLLYNAVGAILYRMKGVDYFLTIADRVPSSIPFQHGMSIWQPTVSTIPGYQYFVSLEPQYSQLSLGRYVDQQFVSQAPSTDPSSQSMTYPGDLYLNFGLSGLFIGMLFLGVIFAWFDLIVSLDKAIGAAVFSFVGLPLIGIESNIAYSFVTSALRLLIAAVLVSFLYKTSLIARRSSRSTPG